MPVTELVSQPHAQLSIMGFVILGMGLQAFLHFQVPPWLITPIGDNRGRLGGGNRERGLLLPVCLLFLSAPLRNMLHIRKGSRVQVPASFHTPTPATLYHRGNLPQRTPPLVGSFSNELSSGSVRNAISSEVRVLALQVQVFPISCFCSPGLELVAVSGYY